MTITGSGPLNLSTIGAEYNAPSVNLLLSQLQRGHTSLYVRGNAADNVAVNRSAGVPATPVNLQMGHFYGQGKGWTYTNSLVQINSYYPHGHFGADWLGINGTDWPCDFINNNGVYSTSTATYAMIIYGRQNNGPCTFTNNSEIQGAGGAANSGAGQHAIYLYNSENASYANRPIIVNNYAIRGGGGGGGKGGTGGTGGGGYYDTVTTSGPFYTPGTSGTFWQDNGSTVLIRWSGTIVYNSTDPGSSVDTGTYTYVRGAGQPAPVYAVSRQSTTRTNTNGGAGGAGGNGGQGIGYNDPATAGVAGANGAGGGTNAGAGGKGGTGGTGGTWGTVGNTGNTGATGASGNYSGGLGGVAGVGGGAAGYSIYAASKWGYANYNTNNGPYGGGVANS